MPGLARRVDQLPPGKACQGCYLTQNENISFYVETGIFTEVEGSLYLCNRCFHEMVRVTDEYVTNETLTGTLVEIRKEVTENIQRLHDLNKAADILKREFGLNLDDLPKYESIKKKLTELISDRESISKTLADSVIQVNENKTTIAGLEVVLDELIEKVNKKNEELNELIYSSLTQVLVKRGREDLIDIIFNNRLPGENQPASRSDEREVDEPSGELQSVLSFPE